MVYPINRERLGTVMHEGSFIQKLDKGLSSYQIKFIALLFMTIDHLGAFGSRIPIFAQYNTTIRTLGRIAAPLFLYMVVESARYTRNRRKFLFRLYAASVAGGLFNALTNFFLGQAFGVHSLGKIIFTFLYTVIYIYLLEAIIDSIKKRHLKTLFLCVLGSLSTIIVPFLLTKWTFGPYSWIPGSLSKQYHRLLSDLFQSFVISPLNVEYSFIFVLVGLLFYFTRGREIHCIIYAAMSILSFVGWRLHIYNYTYMGIFGGFFSSLQYLMILALPFVLLYNGEKGKSHKYFFYVYYPLHQYIIVIISTLAIAALQLSR
jgi:hypothetical protein